jgi:steroid delta-isomerase-like uncharacterized protein
MTVYEDVALAEVNHGKQELKAWLSFTIPDMKFEIKSFFSIGDWVAHEWVMTGTHTGDFGGIPATCRRFLVRGASITQLNRGKISRNTDYWNLATMLQQLGAMSAMGHTN